MKPYLITTILLIVAVNAAFAQTAPVRIYYPTIKRRITPKIDTSFTLSNVFKDNMVIQRDKPIRIWGRAAAGDIITVNISWKSKTYLTVANSSNNWSIVIPSVGVKRDAQSITCSNSAQKGIITVNNILIGDVWVCAGQSNMVMPVAPRLPSFAGVLSYETELATANYSQIRLGTVYPDSRINEADTLVKALSWKECTPATAANFSAVAYYFGRKINTELNVPVGLIVAAVNGSLCESWVSKDALSHDKKLSNYYRGAVSVLYNGMINPLKNLAIRGFIWYQGESNEKNQPDKFAALNTALINDWIRVHFMKFS